MNYLCCGADIEGFQKTKSKETEKKIYERKMEFEETYKAELKYFREDKKRIFFAIGFFLTFLYSLVLLFSSPAVWIAGGPTAHLVALCLITCLVMGYWAMKISGPLSNERKKLWDEFCRLHPIK